MFRKRRSDWTDRVYVCHIAHNFAIYHWRNTSRHLTIDITDRSSPNVNMSRYLFCWGCYTCLSGLAFNGKINQRFYW